MKKLLFIIIVVFFICGYLLAQEPDTVWSKIHDITNDIDEGNCVRQTMDGGYIVTGSCVPDGLVSHIDLLLLKTDVSGNIMWTKKYHRNLIENGYAVEQTSDGGYIIGGRALNGSYPFHDPVYSDAWILKTDANGDTLWTRTYGNNGNEYYTSIQQTTDSGYIMTGTMNSGKNYPNYEINEEYKPDTSRAWIVKTDSNGDTLWTRTYHERSYGNCIRQTSDGGYIMVGWVFPDEHDNQSDVLLIKTNSSGDVLWTKNIGGDDYDAGFCVRQTADAYLIVGQTKPIGLPYDALVIKTDLSGEIIWSKTFGGELSDATFSVDVSQDGFFITGVTNSHWWVHAGDMWAFEIDADANVLWEKIYDVRTCDIAFSGIQSSDGSYVVTGMTSFGFGGDLWLAKIGKVPTGIKDTHAIVTGYVLYQNYPNPFNPSTIITYSIPKPGFVSLEIYDMLGRKLQTLVSDSQESGKYSINFDASQLSSGIYFYKLKVGDNLVQTKKMIFVR